MNTEVCPKCGKMRNARGLRLHLLYCGRTPSVVKEKYPKQKAVLSPEAYARFVRKAEATI